MSVKLLLEQFDRLAEAPDAIPRLRQFILDLAVRGKLVEQDPEDEPASAVLKRVGVVSSKVSRRESLDVPQADRGDNSGDGLFDIPRSWKWVRLSDVLTKLTDGTHHSPPNRSSGEFLYITAKNIKPAGISLDNVSYVSKPIHDEIYGRCNPVKGDVLYIKDGATTGVVTINNLDEPFSMLSSVALLKPSRVVFNRLLVEFLRSPFCYEQMRGFMKGAAIPRVTLKRMAPTRLPLPPLAEQHRIVAKVDELMALCDRLETAQAERERRRDRLVAASLHRLNTTSDPAAFRADARFHLRHLPRMTARADQIVSLRASILNLAVCGRLLPQNPGDESPSVLLAECDRCRREVAVSDRRADAENQPIAYASPSSRVPRSWEWRALSDLVLFIDYRGKTPAKRDSGIRLITAKNVRKGFVNPSPEEYVSEETYGAWMTRGLPRKGDVLFTTEAPMGNAAVVRSEERFALAQRVISFRPYWGLDSEFLVLQLLAEPFQATLDRAATGLTAKGIKAAKLRCLPVAVPPLSEQRRIVEMVKSLMSMLEALELRLATSRAKARGLFEGVLHRSLATEANISSDAS